MAHEARDPLAPAGQRGQGQGDEATGKDGQRGPKPPKPANGKGKSSEGSKGGKKGGGRNSGKGRNKGGYGEKGSEWDAAQRDPGRLQLTLEDLQRVRPQRCVEAFPHLTVCSDWPEAGKPVPRSGSAFYLPLIWTALLPPPGASTAEIEASPAVAQLQSLGDERHFKGVRRASLADVQQGQVFWRQIFSGWDGWVQRLRIAMASFRAPDGQSGLDALVSQHVKTVSVTAGAVVYGDLNVLGALPHISNARKSPDQDAILELDLMLRMEVEASVQTLYADSCEIEELGNLLWTMSRQPAFAEEGPCQRLAARCAAEADAFTSQQLANVLQCLCRIPGQEVASEALAKAACRCMRSFSDSELVSSAWCLAQMGRCDGLVEALSEEVGRRLYRLSPQELVSLAGSFATMSETVPELMRSMVSTILGGLDHLAAQDVRYPVIIECSRLLEAALRKKLTPGNGLFCTLASYMTPPHGRWMLECRMVSDGALRASSTRAARALCEVTTCIILLGLGPGLQRSLDYFRSPVQGILQEETWLGFSATVVAAVLCSTLLALQLYAFLENHTASRLEIDSDQSELLRISFNVSIADLSCDYATVGVFDAFGNVRSNLTRDVQKQPIDHRGAEKGHAYTDEELTELEYADRPKLSAEEQAQLDADWLSAGQVERGDFHDALEAHDVVFVLFCIRSAAPCKMMMPAWVRWSKDVNEGHLVMKDADGARADAWALQVNCGAEGFPELCEQESVTRFPLLRLYPRSVTERAKAPHRDLKFAFPAPILLAMDMFEGMMIMDPKMAQQCYDAFTRMAVDVVKGRHLHTHVTKHEVFEEGCRVSGHIDVPRVPGTIHIHAKSAGDHVLNTAFTNVSHTVHHLSFGRPLDAVDEREELKSQLPEGYGVHGTQVDGRIFASKNFHQGAHHYIKIVHTRLESNERARLYLYTHQWYMQTYPRHESPKVKLSFDLAPVEVVISLRRHWYDFVTTTLALVGGGFSCVQMAYSFFHGIGRRIAPMV
ncbi:PDIL5-3 [Symbiodinium necroappetens]|uniref:PDIL5-3 protein n=1 Tax=Symbiodinium necroappetens TaxID=1628268 RepID=A0A812TPW1_9DINO|nr:PDIL5-3 [Symbiodinium necroappetens]